MDFLYSCLFLLIFSVMINCGTVSDEEDLRKRIVQQITKKKTVLRDGYQLVSRHTATDIYMFKSYRTVSVVLFSIEEDVTDAYFTFQAEELHFNTIGSCSPKNVIVNLKRGAYPALNPDGYEFPEKFIDSSLREPIHTIELTSNSLPEHYSIKNPKPGNWYVLAYIQWENPKQQKVEQQGLVAKCQSILYSDLQIQKDRNIKLVDCYKDIILNHTDLPINLKCIAKDDVEPIALNVTVLNSADDKVSVKIQPLSLPTDEDYIINCTFDPKISKLQTIHFAPHPTSWHYISLSSIDRNTSLQYADCESYILRTDVVEIENQTLVDFMRDDKAGFFTFGAGVPTSDTQDVTSLINVTSCGATITKFRIRPVLDNGGNLLIKASLLLSAKYYGGYVRPQTKGSLVAFSESSQFFKVVICLELDHASVPSEDGFCKYNDKEKPALFVLNSTDSLSIFDEVIIPYPESGFWYLSMRLFCDGAVCPCPTSDNGTNYYVGAIPLGRSNPDVSWDKMRNGTDVCNTTVVLSINSAACIHGQCMNRGECMLNTFGGMLMSFCQCPSGYGGWDCSDSSRLDSYVYMLLSVLLLTLSNLLFIFSVYVALIRLYFTEAIMYAFTMIFSTFYHACDAPPQVMYCISKIGLLQFGDFYCGLMSFWVTLLAMSIIHVQLRSALQLTGAIVIAILTIWNMHSFVSFVLPVAFGLAVVLLSWYLDFHTHKKFRYPRTYYLRYLPVGIVLVSIGLICYAFLQTEKNYKVVHSIWHMIVALSVGFLLPDVRRNGNARNPFMPSVNYVKLSYRRIFKRPRPVSVD